MRRVSMFQVVRMRLGGILTSRQNMTWPVQNICKASEHRADSSNILRPYAPTFLGAIDRQSQKSCLRQKSFSEEKNAGEVLLKNK